MILLNEIDITPWITTFPDGTKQVWKLPKVLLKEGSTVDWVYKEDSEIFLIIQLGDLLCWKNARLRFCYAWYGRQDKSVSNTTTFAGTVIYHMLEDAFRCQYYGGQVAFHPHSEAHLCAWCTDYTLPELGNYDCIIYPDKSAYKRYHKSEWDGKVKILQKERNQLTGKIEFSNLEVLDKIQYGRVLILDDICDGGGSFLPIINSVYVPELDLFTAHGIYSNNAVAKLKEAGCNKIMCYRTIDKEYPPEVEVFEVPKL